jgi:DNA-binding transcriptional LysR family regulator
MDQKPANDPKKIKGAQSARSFEALRFLSVDDLLILSLLGEQELSVTAAAEALSLTQPAVTQRLRKMEDIFGEKLTARKGRGIELTPYGKTMALRAKNALAALRGREETAISPDDRTESTSQL